MKNEKRKGSRIAFAVTLFLVMAVFVLSFVKTDAFNKVIHKSSLAGYEVFVPEDSHKKELSVIGVPRSGTWTKVFDFNNEGLTEHNFQAYTYDFTFSNNTRDEVSDFRFKLLFSREPAESSRSA